jgi:hypothetical protein
MSQVIGSIASSRDIFKNFIQHRLHLNWISQRLSPVSLFL